MAKIGLAFGGAAIGFLLGGPLGAQIGFAIGGVLGSIFFPGKLPPGPRVNDLIVSSATDGAPIPFGYGTTRVAGNVIWAPPIVESSKSTSAKGGPKSTTYSYTASLAVAFGEGNGGGAGVPPAQLDKEVTATAVSTLITVSATPVTQSEVALLFFDRSNPNDIVGTPGAPWALVNVGFAGVYFQVIPTVNPVTASVSLTGGEGAGGADTWVAMMALFGGTGVAPTWTVRGSGSGFSFPGNIGSSFTPTPHNSAFLILQCDKQSAFIENVYNVTDNQGNNWVLLMEKFGTGNPGGSFVRDVQNTVWYCADLKGGLTQAHISLISGTGVPSQWFLFEASGLGSLISPSSVGRIWFDSKIVYDPSVGTDPDNPINAPITSISEVGNTVTVTSTLNPPIGDQVKIAGAPSGYNGTFQVLLSSPVSFTYFLQKTGLSSGSGGTATLPPIKYPPPVIYAGGEDQQADPTIQSVQGAANTPAFRGLIYAVWHNFPLADFGNRIPNVRGEITYTVATPTISDQISDICTRCGLLTTDIDVTQIATLAGVGGVANAGPGYVIGRPTTGQNALKPLALAFFFDAVESGGVVKFVPRGGANASLTIPESDLGLQKDNLKLTEQIGMAQDLPREFQVLFNDKSLDYQQNKQHKRRHTRIVKTKQETVIELPMVLDSTTARQIAEKALFLAYLERKPFDTNLWKALYLLYDPTDVIQFVYEGLTFQMRIVKLDIGTDFQVAISGVNEDAQNYLSQVVGTSGTGVTPGSGVSVPDTILFLFDIPLLRDVDASASAQSGYYFAMSSVTPLTWPGASLQMASDNINFAEDSTSATAAHYGTASTILGAPVSNHGSPWVWDMDNTLTIFMTQGTLAGTTDLAVLNGANALLYGSEVIQYVNAVQNPDSSFTISRLLRGRRGTEGSVGTHQANEMVVDLNVPGMVRKAVPLSRIQVLRYYRPVTFGQDISTVTSQLFTDTGADLKPYAPTSLAGSRDISGNLALTWIRRTRIGGDWLDDSGTVPLSETIESYDIEIMNGASVVRTFFAIGSPIIMYTVAQQIVDFGSPQASVKFNVYQNSSTIGRGYKSTATV